jgi:16S rRNA (adenine1518-N6/adenine1519-N6)-dimethyltransferase
MNIEEVQRLASRYNLTPSKSKGQNFLLDDQVVLDIAHASGVGEGDHVIEVGPGFGVLTQELLRKGADVHVIELDVHAIAYIKDALGEAVDLIQGDVLSFSNQELAERVGESYHVVANIPYNITSPILRKFTEEAPRATSMTLMIQKEVAQRVSARPGQMSILAIALQLYGQVNYLFEVPKEVFWPQPKVDSGVIHWVKDESIRKNLKVSERDFFRIVKFGFSAKRKKLVNTLAAGLHRKPSEIAPLLKDVGVTENARAQELSLQQWIDLANKIYS